VEKSSLGHRKCCTPPSPTKGRLSDPSRWVLLLTGFSPDSPGENTLCSLVGSSSDLMGLPLYLRRVGALYEALLREGIVQLREEAPFFRWASSCLSSIYLGFRRCLAYPMLRRALIEGLLAYLREGNPFFRAVAGVATGGISWAAWIAERLDLPMGYVRNTPKAHSTSQIVEALLPPHSPVLLIEDVLSTGSEHADFCRPPAKGRLHPGSDCVLVGLCLASKAGHTLSHLFCFALPAGPSGLAAAPFCIALSTS